MKKLVLLFSTIGFLFGFSNTAFAQPANNACASAVALSVNGACVNGTLVSATLEAGEPTPTCDVTNTNSVWYTFTAISTGTATISTTFAGMNCYQQNTAVYSGTCGSFTQIGCDATNAFTQNLSVAVTNGVTYYVQFTYGTGMGCGSAPTFCAAVSQALPAHCSNGIQDADETGVDCGGADCPACVVCTGTGNDDCATEAVALTSGVTVSDCTTGAAVGPAFPTAPLCDMSVTSTVWYSFTTSATETAVIIDLQSSCMTAPQFAIYSGCGTVLTTSCTIGNNSTYTGLVPSTTYYLAVSDYNNGQCNFDLTVTTFEDVASCLTGYTFTANAASPYSAGQTVCFTFVVTDWNKAACNWLQGFVPDYGPCWDPASFTSSAPTGGSTGGTWIWDPTVLYNVSATQYQAGDNVGPGWFWMNSSDPGYATNPDAAWGNHGGCAGNACNNCANDITWQFCLTVRDTCEFGTDCMVSVKTFADGETGNWTSPGCQSDLPKFLYPSANPALCPLSVEFLEFYAEQLYEGNNLKWTTASETNNEYFLVERSSDGRIFYNLGSVPGSGTTNIVSHYEFMDAAPLNGMNYYRIRQFDYDGNSTSSRIIMVNAKTDVSVINSYPNPAEDRFNVELNVKDDANYIMELTDMSGRVVVSNNYRLNKGNQKIEIVLSDISGGLYYITFRKEGSSTIPTERIKMTIK